MAKGMIKTNAMRILDKEKIAYQHYTYEHDDNAIDGVSVAMKLNQDPARVFKTLVTQGHSREYYVFVIPVAKELRLKEAAKAVGEKSVAMIKVSDINKVTGYIRGGCSPIGMKKQFKTTIHINAQEAEKIFFSGGRVGCQVCTSPKNLEKVIRLQYKDIIKDAD